MSMDHWDIPIYGICIDLNHLDLAKCETYIEANRAIIAEHAYGDCDANELLDCADISDFVEILRDYPGPDSNYANIASIIAAVLSDDHGWISGYQETDVDDKVYLGIPAETMFPWSTRIENWSNYTKDDVKAIIWHELEQVLDDDYLAKLKTDETSFDAYVLQFWG